jgi:hypothetical protein
MSTGVAACAFVGAALCAVTVADAQTITGRPTKEEAVAHFQQGNAHYKVRDFEQAVQEYKAGALIEPAAIFDYNLGQCYRQLARYEDAIWHYERYLHSGIATPQETTVIKQWITQMKAELDQRARSTPPTEPATLQLQPEPQPLAVRTSVEPWYNDAFGWSIAGVGVAIGAIGTGLLIDAARIRSDANSALSQQERNALDDKADTRSLAGGVFVAVGGGLLVTGIVKLAIHDHEATATQTTWSLGVGQNTVFAVGRF